jgi:hypothetical protein
MINSKIHPDDVMGGVLLLHPSQNPFPYTTRNTCMQQPLAYIFQTLTYRISN